MEQWIQVLSLFLANAGLILWFRSESRSDWRQMYTKLDASINAMRIDMKEFQTAMMIEVKDFHGRLCAIEEKYRERKK